jgi:hypothetical protein
MEGHDMTNDESRSINPADNELATIAEDYGPDEVCPFDGRLFTDNGECPKCGYRDFIRETTPDLEAALAELEATGAAIRAERDRLGLELEAARQARRIVELGASEELWRWRFTWFAAAVETAARLEQISDEVGMALDKEPTNELWAVHLKNAQDWIGEGW